MLSAATFPIMSIPAHLSCQYSDGSDLGSDDEAVNEAVENTLATQSLGTGGDTLTPATGSSNTALSDERVNIREIWLAITEQAHLQQQQVHAGPAAPQTPKPKRQRRNSEDPELQTPETKPSRRSISQSTTNAAPGDHQPERQTECSSPLFANCTCSPCGRNQ